MRWLCLVMGMLAAMPAFSVVIPDSDVRQHCSEYGCSNQVFYQYFDDEKERFCHEREVITGDTNKAGMLYYVSQRLEDGGLPHHMAVVPLLESSLRLDVSASRGSAKGLWQFTSATAKDVGLIVDGKLDERTDLSRSTDAGIAYLSYLINHYEGDQNLAVMAFHMGLGRVDRMITRHNTKNPWYLSRLITDSKPDRDYLLKYHAYALVLTGKGCSV